MDTVPLNPKKENTLWETIKFIIIALLIVVPIRLFVAQPFIVNGASMEPTFNSDEYLIVDQLSYNFENPQRGDVIIFRYPNDTSKYFIKRVIGLPGESVEVRNGYVTIFKNGKNSPGFILQEPYISARSNDEAKMWDLGADEYFVMGDNRPSSLDSRSWGLLNRKFLIGRPLLRLLPLTKISLFPGQSEIKSATTNK